MITLLCRQMTRVHPAVSFTLIISTYSIEHKKCYLIVIGKDKYIYLRFTTSP